MGCLSSVPQSKSEKGETAESEGTDSRAHESLKIATLPPLLPVPHIATSGDKLCDTCQALELTPTKFVVSPDDPETSESPEIHFGLVRDIRKKTSCPLCRLVVVALGGSKVPEEENGEPTSVVLSWGTDGPIIDPEQPWNCTPEIRILRPSCSLASGEFVSLDKLNFFPEITLLANDSPVPDQTLFARPILQEKIDFGMVRNWLKICEVWHGDDCNQVEMLDTPIHPADEIPDFRVIDVVDNCLVHGETNCTYAALSYVWGRAKVLCTLEGNVDKLEQSGSLNLPEFLHQIPWTIRDAMQATREIGLRYLWVDSLCIVQDDTSGHKAHAISKMDLVYGMAFVTIIAATGDSANAGLPGVRPGTRNYRQPIEEIAPGFRLAFKPRMVDYVRDAVYETRGWTFQEKCFSRRSLRFIGGGVVFSCRRGNDWREDVLFENETGIVGNMTTLDEEDDIGKFEGLIQSYSGLNLTFDSDIYNAFAGISTYISRELNSNLCHGIPEAYFDWFLLWTNLGEQKRRERAPSWSWSGWAGESWPRIWDWYTRDIDRVRQALQKRTWIIWYQRTAHDSEECRLVWDYDCRSSKSHQKNFYGGNTQQRFNLDCTQTGPTPRTLVGAPEYFPDSFNPRPGSGFLQFWTVSATFRLDTPTSPGNNRGPKKLDSRFGILGASGKEIGHIYVNKNWRSGSIAGEHEFILLCEARDERAEHGKDPDNEEGWRYMVMLLEWHGQWAERVSVGSIMKDKLNEGLGGGPVWKEIILG